MCINNERNAIGLMLILCVLLKCNGDECNTFKNATAEVYLPDTRFPFPLRRGYYKRVSGCLTPEVLDSTIYFISFKGANIPIFMRDSIKDFLHLDELYLTGNNISTLEEGALNNLPLLRVLYLTRNYIKEIPDNFFKNLSIETLGFDGNQIDFLSSSAFAGTSKMKWIYAGDNKLSNFNREWFRESLSLEGIYMQNNQIRILPRKAFYNNQKLTNIDFSNNNIDTIETDAFEGLTNLKILNLTHNVLRHLSPASFPIGIKIEKFLIEANRLNYLHDELIDKINVVQLYLEGNPWKCPCLTQLTMRLISKGSHLSNSIHTICTVFAKCVAPLNKVLDCYYQYDNEATEYFYNQQKYLKDLATEFMCLRF